MSVLLFLDLFFVLRTVELHDELVHALHGVSAWIPRHNVALQGEVDLSVVQYSAPLISQAVDRAQNTALLFQATTDVVHIFSSLCPDP